MAMLCYVYLEPDGITLATTSTVEALNNASNELSICYSIDDNSAIHISTMSMRALLARRTAQICVRYDQSTWQCFAGTLLSHQLASTKSVL
jgi:hypothetical protein